MENTIQKTYCRGCDTYFAGVVAHEKHRVGDFGGTGKEGRRCLTREDMLHIGLSCEKKLVRMLKEGKEYFEEHDVWFVVADRERVISRFRQEEAQP